MTDRYNAFDVVKTFEDEAAKFTGAPRAVAVDTCTMALFLSLKLCRQAHDTVRDYQPGISGVFDRLPVVKIPKRTFISVPIMAIQAGWMIQWVDRDWHDYYQLDPLPVFDAAICLRKDMFKEPERCGSPPHVMCLSFQYRKPLPIGRGGMILHNLTDQADSWLRRARFFGRHEVPIEQDPGPEFLGWHGYMEPERAANGLTQLMRYPDEGHQVAHVEYPDLSEYEAFKPYTVAGAIKL